MAICLRKKAEKLGVDAVALAVVRAKECKGLSYCGALDLLWKTKPDVAAKAMEERKNGY